MNLRIQVPIRSDARDCREGMVRDIQHGSNSRRPRRNCPLRSGQGEPATGQGQRAPCPQQFPLTGKLPRTKSSRLVLPVSSPQRIRCTPKMNAPPRQPFAIYVVWRPDNPSGATIGRRLYQHFRSSRYPAEVHGSNVGVDVIFRSQAPPGQTVPASVDWARAEVTAVVALLDGVEDEAWAIYQDNLEREARERQFERIMFPVTIHDAALHGEIQALRWDQWVGSQDKREQRLIRELTYEFSRMLRHRLEILRYPTDTTGALRQYRRPFEVFLSHSKHDETGRETMQAINDHLHRTGKVTSFVDVHAIPPGVAVPDIIVDAIRENENPVVAIYTDTYSSREWCRREVIEAKRHDIPLVVIDCLQHVDLRSLPYLGNVPVIRLDDPGNPDRLNQILDILLDELFRCLLWRCRMEPYRDTPHTRFVAHAPELLSIAAMPVRQSGRPRIMVYPDPPLGVEEVRLFHDLASDIQLRSVTAWLAEQQA